MKTIDVTMLTAACELGLEVITPARLQWVAGDLVERARRTIGGHLWAYTELRLAQFDSETLIGTYAIQAGFHPTKPTGEPVRVPWDTVVWRFPVIETATWRSYGGT